MAVKELLTRIALKYDSYSAWSDASVAGKGANLVLLNGELGICEIPSANADSNVAPTVLFKVGNGSKKFSELPWASAKAADVYNWAKASEVKRDGKKLVFVGGAADGSNLEVTFDYVTLSEVQAITNGLASRISSLETSVGSNGEIGKSVADHETRLDKLEGADTVEGSVANALKVAKAYTDTRETAITSAYQTYADQAEADAVASAKSYTDAEAKKVSDAAAKVASDLSAHEAKKDNPHGVTAAQVGLGNVENKSVATIKSELGTNGTIEANKTGFATGGAVYTAVEAAKSAAIDHADGLNTAMNTRVGNLESFKTAQETKNGELAQDITDEATARENADKAINDKIGGSFDATNTVAKAIAAAQTNAEANAATTAQSKVDALANGQVKLNKEAISAMDAAYKAADAELDGRLDAVEGKLANVTNVMDFRGAVEELPAVTGYQDGDVIVVTAGDNKGKEYVLSNGAWVEFGNTDANSAAISALQGRMTTAEGDIDKLEGRAGALEAADLALDQRLDAIEGANGAIAQGDAATLASAKSYTDGRETAIRSELKTAYEAYADKSETDAVASAKSYTDGQISSLKSTLEAADDAIETDVKALQDIVNGYSAKGSIKSAVDAKLATATFDTWTAEHEDGHAKSATEITAEITSAVNTEKSARETAVSGVDAKVTALGTRVGTAEGNITTLQGIVSSGADANAKLRTDIAELQGIVKTGADANATLRSDLKTLQDVVNHSTTGLAATKAIADSAKTKAEDAQSRVAKIEADYIKAADELIFNCGTSTEVVHVKAAQ